MRNLSLTFFPDLDPLMLQNDPFHFDADPILLFILMRIPAFHFDAYPDPDPASQNDADPKQ